VAARQAAGLASALERDEAVRALIAVDGAQLALHREQLAAWLQLYRALGGGWQQPATGQAASPASKG